MSWIKGDNDKEQEYFNYLERLRQSGTTNMWAASSYLKKAFPRNFRNVEEAGKVLSRWMTLHNHSESVLEEEPK